MLGSTYAIIKDIVLPVNQQAIGQTWALKAAVKGMNLPPAISQTLTLELDGSIFNLECAKDFSAITHPHLVIGVHNPHIGSGLK